MKTKVWGASFEHETKRTANNEQLRVASEIVEASDPYGIIQSDYSWADVAAMALFDRASAANNENNTVQSSVFWKGVEQVIAQYFPGSNRIVGTVELAYARGE